MIISAILFTSSAIGCAFFKQFERFGYLAHGWREEALVSFRWYAHSIYRKFLLLHIEEDSFLCISWQ